MFMKRILLVALVAIIAGAAYFFLSSADRGPKSFGNLKEYAVVQSLGSSELVLVGVKDDEVAGTVSLPVRPDKILISAAANRIIYSNKETNTVSVYDLGLQVVETSLELTFSPGNIVLSPDGFVVAAAGPDAGKVAIIKLEETELISTIEGLDAPENMAFSDDTEYLFVSNNATSQLKVINAFTGLELDPIDLKFENKTDGAADIELSALTRTPNGLHGVIVDKTSGYMSIINFREWEEVGVLKLGKQPSRAYGTADGQFMLVANEGDSTISIIATEFFNVVATLPGVSSVTSISTGYFETLAMVVSDKENRALLIDLTTMELVGDILLEGTPGPAVSDANGRKIYVTKSETNELVIFDAFGRKILKTLKGIGSRPWNVSLAVTNNYCH